MNKKIIILVFIAIILINTIYWINITLRVFGFSVDTSDDKRYRELQRELRENFPQKSGEGKIGKYFKSVDLDKLSKEEYEKYEKIQEELKPIVQRQNRRFWNFTSRIVRIFKIEGRETIPIIILTITDAVLIATSFMIILLYKKE
ncbi:hypothetical protein ES702_07100 [subsurface metagenome]